MTWQESPYAIVFIVNAAVTLGVTLWILRRRPALGARTVAVAALTLAGWSLTEAGLRYSTSLQAKMWWTKAALLPAGTGPVALLAFVLRSGHPPRGLTRRQISLLAIEPALTLLIGWTNEAHGWMWRMAEWDTTGLVPLLRLTYGPWLTVHTAYTYVLLAAGVGALMQRLRQTTGLRRQQGVAVLVAGLAAWGANVTAMAVPRIATPALAAGMTVSNALLVWSLFQLRLFGLVPLARATVLDQLDVGVIILDRTNRVVELNAAAERLLGRPASEVLGQPPQQVFSRYAEHLERWQHKAPIQDDLVLDDGPSPRYYDLRISPLVDPDGDLSGNLVMLYDVTDRRQLEAENLQRRQYLERLLDAAPDAIISVDHKYDIVEWNAGAERLFGYTAEETHGRNLDELVSGGHEQTLEQARSFSERLVQGERLGPTEVVRYHKDGSPVNVVLTASPISVSDELVGVVGIYADLRPLKEAEEALVQSEARYRAVVEDQTEFITRFGPDGALTFVNEAACRFLGRDREELLGHPYGMGIPQGDSPMVSSPLSILSPTNPVIRFETRLVDANGEMCWLQWTSRGIFDQDGTLAEVQSVGRDVTESRLSEETMREAEARYRTLVETSPDAITLTDLEGKVLLCNRQAALLHGYAKPEDMLGMSSLQLFAPEEQDRARENTRRILGRGSVHAVEYTLVRRDGSRFVAELSASVIRDAMLRPTSFVTVTRDVSSRKRVAARLEASLREKDMLLGEIHHRVNSNLQLVSSLLFLQALQADDEETRRILEHSRSRVHSMALAHEKLYASRDLERIDLRDYAASLTASLLVSDDPARAVEMRTEIEDLILPVDLAIPCGLLINELLSNAIEHGFPEGATGQIELRCRRTNGEYLLEVRDTGVGIPADVDAHTPSSLGLQLVNMLVEQLHGTLQVETGDGTRVSITFPAQSGVIPEREP